VPRRRDLDRSMAITCGISRGRPLFVVSQRELNPCIDVCAGVGLGQGVAAPVAAGEPLRRHTCSVARAREGRVYEIDHGGS
jgi:hypothetical protein